MAVIGDRVRSRPMEMQFVLPTCTCKSRGEAVSGNLYRICCNTKHYRTKEAMRTAVFEYIVLHDVSTHKRLGYMSPREYLSIEKLNLTKTSKTIVLAIYKLKTYQIKILYTGAKSK
jgi:hypothetical protein